jgi:hypothetical protein
MKVRRILGLLVLLALVSPIVPSLKTQPAAAAVTVSSRADTECCPMPPPPPPWQM